MTTDYGGPPPTTDTAGSRAGCSPETETPGPVVSRVADARAWLGEFYADLGDDGRVRLATLDHHGDGWAEFARGLRPGPGIDLPGYLDALAVALVNEADAGRDVFACPYPHPGPRRKGGATTRRHVHADVDGPLDLARVRFVGGLAVASGGLADDGETPRGHVYVRLSESVPAHVHGALCRALGAHVGGEGHDASKTSDEDVLRPAGTLNHKPENGPEPRPVRWLVGPDDDRVRTWEPETLARLLGLGWPIPEPEPDPGPVTAHDGPSFKPGLNVGGSLRRLDGLARSVTDAPPGNGNARLNWAAGKAAAICTTDPDAPGADEVRAALVAAYLARPIPRGESVRSRETEARRTVASAWRWGSTHPTDALRDRDDRPAYDDETTTTNGDDAVTTDHPSGNGDDTDGNGGPGHSGRRRMRLTPASAIKPRRVRWLWDGRLALGSLGLLAGREGLGKSSCAYWLAGQVTRGALPGEHHGEPRAVLVCATEDSWAHTIVPRLIAAGADLERVYRVEVETSEGLHGTLSLPGDLPGLTEAARETAAALLLLDPLTSRLTEALDTHKDAEVRRALEPLVTAADRADIAVLGLMHHNKSGSTDPLSLVMGSRAFTAVARSVHTVVPDPDDDAVRLFGTPKNNLGRSDLPTLSFRMESAEVPTDDGPASVGRVVWGDSIAASIGDVMRRSAALAARGGAPSATDDAAGWLLDFLTAYGGPEPDLGPGRWVESKRVKDAAADAGHGERPLRDARNRLGVVSESVGFPRRTWWGLPHKGSRDVSGDVSRGDVTTDMTGSKGAGQHSRDSHDVRGGTGTTGVTTESPLTFTDRYGRSLEVSE